MGEFDDVLAMESSDDWGEYVGADGGAPTQPLPALLAELRLPSATMQLRGDVPGAVLDALATLTVEPPVSSLDPGVAILTVVDEGRSHLVVDRDRGELGHASTDDELVDLITQHLLDLAERADPRQLHLRGAVVQLPDGRGVLIVDDDTQARRSLVAALVADGALYLGADRFVIEPGCRTVLAVPTPLLDRPPLTPDQVATATTIAHVVIVDRGGAPGREGLEPLGRAHGCARLLVDGLRAGMDGHAMVEAISTLVAGAGVHELVARAPAVDAAAIASIDGSCSRELVVSRRLGRRHDLVVVRFRHGGVLADVGRGLAFELAIEELPTLDVLGRPVGARDRDAESAVLDQIAAAGIDLRPLASDGIAPVPGPQSYGLHGAPVGQACSGLWSSAAVSRALAEDPGLAGSLAHAHRMGDVVLDAQSAASVATAAGSSVSRNEAVLSTLDQVLDVLSAEGVEPLVLGSIVLALDGPLPADMVALGDVELLLAADDLSRCQDVLAGHGFVAGVDGDAASSDDDLSGLSPAEPDCVRMIRSDSGVGLVVRSRLAAGPFGELVDHDELRDRAVIVRRGDRWVRALHPDDRFVWACVRLLTDAASEPGFQRLREVVLDAPVSSRGMASALETSERWGATQTVLAAIRAVDAALPGLSPWLIERANRPSPPPDRRRRRGRRRI